MKLMYPEASRRVFLKTLTAATASLVLPGRPWQARGGPVSEAGAITAAELPRGAAPMPLWPEHFPDRLHAFVWRNWGLVPTDRLARVVGARPDDILRVGLRLGLGRPPRISRQQQARSYLTVIRRNWHLLPYEQLLELLEWTPEQMAFTLREDDFLYVKLGNLKPDCAPLRYQAPDPAMTRHAARLGEIVAAEFPEGASRTSDPLFAFVSRLSTPPARAPRPGKAAPTAGPAGAAPLRFCYSYFALYGDPLLEPEADPYPAGYLARLAQAGVTGVWLQAVLHKLGPCPWMPERSARWEERLKNLRSLVARARRENIRVWLYLNEPRALPLRFFESRPQLKGVVEGDHAALCTSVPDVQNYLRDAIARICRAVPDLGGFFTITASENLSNCWSHGGGAQCPRCGKRAAAEVIGEVNRLIADGIRQAGSRAELIAWDWGWNDAWAEAAIGALPAEAALMSVSEWSLPIERGGIKSSVGEYCLSAIGPGPRALRHWKAARQRGLKTLAKVQAGNTWELSAVPYIPAIENVARHGENLRGAGVDGVMLGWTLGGYPSPNLEVMAETLDGAPAEEAMRRVAERRFGPRLAPEVVRAWRGFSAAFREFPFHINVAYSGPQQLGPANLLWAQPTGYAASMVGFPYDALDQWRAVYPAEIYISQLEKVARGFDTALTGLKQAAGKTSGLSRTHRRALGEECSVAEAAAIHFRSCANQAQFVLARQALAAAGTESERAGHKARLRALLEAEALLARRLWQLQSRDSRIGFEASNQYYYVPLDLVEKVLNCRDLLERWLRD